MGRCRRACCGLVAVASPSRDHDLLLLDDHRTDVVIRDHSSVLIAEREDVLAAVDALGELDAGESVLVPPDSSRELHVAEHDEERELFGEGDRQMSGNYALAPDVRALSPLYGLLVRETARRVEQFDLEVPVAPERLFALLVEVHVLGVCPVGHVVVEHGLQYRLGSVVVVVGREVDLLANVVLLVAGTNPSLFLSLGHTSSFYRP